MTACTVITPTEEVNTPHIELYDSGATKHISPYKSDFSSYVPLSPPVYLNTVNQQHFPAIGTRTLVVHVPNGGTESKCALHKTLHAPSVVYMLISLGMLDREGYHAHIGGGQLELISPNRE